MQQLILRVSKQITGKKMQKKLFEPKKIKYTLTMTGLLMGGLVLLSKENEAAPLKSFTLTGGAASFLEDVSITEEDIFGANREVLTKEAKEFEELKVQVGEIGVSRANDYVNIRDIPSTEGAVIGKAYSGAVITILDEEEGWFHLKSGEVEGYGKAEYFLTGEDLFFRMTENPDWISVDYLSNPDKWINVLSREEEQRIAEEERKRLESMRQNAGTKDENVSKNTFVPTGDSGDVRSQIVDYAMQFLGNKYVHGGNSLTDGTDCSGFTCLIYKEFGYSIDRTPQGQYNNAGKSVDLENIRPGDIVCYGSNGKVSHVALYIGNGQIIHEANSKKGCVIYDIGYDNIAGIKNVID